MKRLFAVLSLAAVVMVSCGKKELEQQVITQQKLNDSIQAILVAKDAEMETLFQELNTIEESLSLITTKYGKVNKLKNASSEVNKDSRSRITSQIQDINELLSQNKQKVAALNERLREDGGRNMELSMFVEKLKNRIDEQEEQIQALTAELQQKRIVIENLNKDIANLSKQNQTKDEQLLKAEQLKNTAYYRIGTKKELQQENIVSTRGGFLGIGKKTNVSGDSDIARYTEIDIRKIEEIPLEGKKIKILTTHPSSSYRLEGDSKKPTSIVILDIAAFWQKSKFLVIMYD